MLDYLDSRFHIGSQISAVRDQDAKAERVYVELAKAGAGLRSIDAGGGLGVD